MFDNIKFNLEELHFFLVSANTAIPTNLYTKPFLARFDFFRYIFNKQELQLEQGQK
jgi:hypothetical protein